MIKRECVIVSNEAFSEAISINFSMQGRRQMLIRQLFGLFIWDFSMCSLDLLHEGLLSNQ